MGMSSDLIKGSVVPIVLSLLSDRAMYGYEIVKVVNARTNGLFEWKEGTLYPTLHRLQGARFISAEWSDAPGRKRKYYHLTAKGKRELAKRAAEWEQFSLAVNACMQGA